MKVLTILSCVQTALLIALIVLAGQNPKAGSQLRSTDVAAVTAKPSDVAVVQITKFDDEHLRRIIREELLNHATPHAMAEDRELKLASASDPAAAMQRQQRRDLVAQHIESYKGVGPISDSQMGELQGEIEQLDDQGRTQMLSLLMRALNTGAIKGQLQ